MRVLQVVGADAVDEATTEFIGTSVGVSKRGIVVSTTELDAGCGVGVDVSLEEDSDSEDGDALVMGAADEGVVSFSVLLDKTGTSMDDGVGVVVGSIGVSDTVADAAEATVSISAGETSEEVCSDAAAVFGVSAGTASDSELLGNMLKELMTASVEVLVSGVVSSLVDMVGISPGAETTGGVAVDSRVASEEEDLSTSKADALELVADVLGEGLSTDTIVFEEDEAG